MNLGDILKSVAPTLATAFLGPLAGAATSFLADKLGTGNTVEAVTQAIAGLSPADMVKMKELDVQFKEFMADNAIKLDLGEQEINKIEAQSNRGVWLDLFIAGWRPYLGWVGGLGIGYQFLLRPLLNGFTFILGGSYAFPALEVQDLIALVTLLLGHSAMRSWDKKNDTSNGS